MRDPLRKRLFLFFLVPAIAAISPLIVLPIVARSAGVAGWASAVAGEAIGTVAAIAIAYGWTAIGPALASVADDDTARGSLYRDSLVVRLLVAAVGIPATTVVCALVADPGHTLLAALMGVQGALIALSFTWYSAGLGHPHAIIVYDSVPRLVSAAASAVAIAGGAAVEIYPVAGIAVTLIGTTLFTRIALRRYPAPWPTRRELPRLFRSGAPVTLNDIALSVYSSVPTPLVTVTASAESAAGFASADKMIKLGQFIPLTLANALQTWVSEATGAGRAARMRSAVLGHAIIGLIGGVALASLGSWASGVLFGEDAASPTPVLVAMGVTFLFFSVRTSLTRHVLFVSGRTRAVVRATLAATVVGVPLMVALTMAIGPVGAAVGYAITETAATALLWQPCRAAMRELSGGG